MPPRNRQIRLTLGLHRRQERIRLCGQIDPLPRGQGLPPAHGYQIRGQCRVTVSVASHLDVQIAPAHAQQTPESQPGTRLPVHIGQHARQFHVHRGLGGADAFVAYVARAVRHGQAQQHRGLRPVVHADVAAVEGAVHLEIVLGLAGEARGGPAAPEGPGRDAVVAGAGQGQLKGAAGQEVFGRGGLEAEEV